MPLQEYPFSPHYGWIEDRYGVSWQLMLTDPEGDPRPFIIPSIMFGHTVLGRASEAMDTSTPRSSADASARSRPTPPRPGRWRDR